MTAGTIKQGGATLHSNLVIFQRNSTGWWYVYDDTLHSNLVIFQP